MLGAGNEPLWPPASRIGRSFSSTSRPLARSELGTARTAAQGMIRPKAFLRGCARRWWRMHCHRAAFDSYG